ncbi:unnamed protein product [Microthlaspi erraticum]|uniref:Transmembrane protein n=1 Tax=Microthlaspi erraticum TaxID=1685480 RepID=A0A6D2I5F5_9BRAS|nr:unnamed protein product [Microthlaspi erraticum]
MYCQDCFNGHLNVSTTMVRSKIRNELTGANIIAVGFGWMNVTILPWFSVFRLFGRDWSVLVDRMVMRISFHRCSRLLEVLSSSAILCIAVGRIELLRLSHVAGTFLVLSFGFADQNDVLRSPVKFGGLRSCRLGDGRALSLGSSILAERVVVM